MSLGLHTPTRFKLFSVSWAQTSEQRYSGLVSRSGPSGPLVPCKLVFEGFREKGLVTVVDALSYPSHSGSQGGLPLKESLATLAPHAWTLPSEIFVNPGVLSVQPVLKMTAF